jgi:hypothetical protein
MAWSESAIYQRVLHLCKHDADESEVPSEVVRTAFEQFALDSLAFEDSANIDIVALQREYPLGNIFLVTQVKLDGRSLPNLPGGKYPSQSWHQRGAFLVLNWEPASPGVLLVRGFSVPASIDGLTVEPQQRLMETVAYLAASLELKRYGDARALARAQAYEAEYWRTVRLMRRRQLLARLEQDGRPRSGQEVSLL